jgi:hypothetical protein
MADLPISGLPSLAVPLTTDVFPIVDGSTTYQTTVLAAGKTIFNANLPITASGLTISGSAGLTVSGSAQISGSLTVRSTPSAVSLRVTGSITSTGSFTVTNDINAGATTQLAFGPGTTNGSNLFLQTSGSLGTNALEIRPYGVNNSTVSYGFIQPQNGGFARYMTFSQPSASITIANGNNDTGITLSRAGLANTGEARLTSGNTGANVPGYITFYTSGSERVRIDGSGSLLVGTSTNNGYATTINGSNTTNFSNGALYVTGSTFLSGSLNVSGSITTNGTITAQTLVVNIVSSSIEYSSGSNIFGSQITNTQKLTGSVLITGSLSAIGAFTTTVVGTTTSQLAFGPGTTNGNNLFLTTSGSSGTVAFEIRPSSIGNNTNSYNFIQPQPAGATRNMTFDQTAGSITITNGNSDQGAIILRPSLNSNELRLNSATNNGATGVITFQTSGTERIRIDQLGNLLVGTNTNNGYLTFLNGANTTNFPSGSLYVTGSSSFTGSINVSGSITTTGTITAQTLVVSIISSSIEYSSGSNIFGSQLSNTQQLTGSVNITGSLNVSGSINASNVLRLAPQSPLPAAASFPNSFAVSSSTPAKPYFSDGTNWNALY